MKVAAVFKMLHCSSSLNSSEFNRENYEKIKQTCIVNNYPPSLDNKLINGCCARSVFRLKVNTKIKNVINFHLLLDFLKR